MAKHIVKYKLHRDPHHGRQVKPSFIEDGGYWSKDGELVGMTHDTTTDHVPAFTDDTPAGHLEKITESELSTRIQTFHNDDTGSNYTVAEADALAASFFSDRGL